MFPVLSADWLILRTLIHSITVTTQVTVKTPLRLKSARAILETLRQDRSGKTRPSGFEFGVRFVWRMAQCSPGRLRNAFFG